MSNLSLITMRRSRLAAWLGLLAVILLFIAPVISKSLAASPAWHGMMMPGMAMDDMMAEADSAAHTRAGTRQHIDMAGDSAAMAADSHSADDVHQPPLSIMDDSACGYCALLVHLPLVLTRLPSLWSVLQAARLPARPLIRPIVARFIPGFFHPRAPPRR